MATPTYIGEADVKENLQIAKEIQSPQVWDGERRRDEDYFSKRDKAMRSENAEEKQIIEDMLNSENELYSYLTKYMIDEKESAMLELVKLAFSSNDDFELGRKFREIAKAVKPSYVSMVK